MTKQATQTVDNRPTLIFSGVVGLILAYAIGSRAIDTGSYWQYLGCLVFLALSIKLLARAFKR